LPFTPTTVAEAELPPPPPAPLVAVFPLPPLPPFFFVIPVLVDANPPRPPWPEVLVLSPKVPPDAIIDETKLDKPPEVEGVV